MSTIVKETTRFEVGIGNTFVRVAGKMFRIHYDIGNSYYYAYADVQTGDGTWARAASVNETDFRNKCSYLSSTEEHARNYRLYVTEMIDHLEVVYGTQDLLGSEEQ